MKKGANPIRTVAEMGVIIIIVSTFFASAMSEYNVSTVQGNLTTQQLAMIALYTLLGFLSIGLGALYEYNILKN